ncbi:MAG: hypothetical protein RL748_1605, partial [Pseudomonadota bacterium]
AQTHVLYQDAYFDVQYNDSALANMQREIAQLESL